MSDQAWAMCAYFARRGFEAGVEWGWSRCEDCAMGGDLPYTEAERDAALLDWYAKVTLPDGRSVSPAAGQTTGTEG